MSNQLKPCPFCFGEAEVERRGTPRQSQIYVCQDCGCRLETGETFGVELWNLRPIEDELRALLVATEALAYIGEKRFPDLTYKARLEELVPDLREAEAELKKERDLADRLARELDQVQWVWDYCEIMGSSLKCPECEAQADKYGMDPGEEAKHESGCTIEAALAEYAERRKTNEITASYTEKPDSCQEK